MKLWRISNYADLSGRGGTKTYGRWHNTGIPVVYLSESPSLAMLEVLVNFELDVVEVPTNYQLLEIDFKRRSGISNLHKSYLHRGWENDVDMTRAIGDNWLVSMKSCLLRVPSAVVPHSFNYLFNPRHELAFNAVIVNASSHPFDNRLNVTS